MRRKWAWIAAVWFLLACVHAGKGATPSLDAETISRANETFFHSKSWKERSSALSKLRLGHAATLENLRTALKDVDPNVRAEGARVAGDLGSELSDEDWNALQAMLRETDFRVRSAALLAILANRDREWPDLESLIIEMRLMGIGDAATVWGRKRRFRQLKSVDMLVSDLQRKNMWHRRAAVECLEYCRVAPEKVLPALAQACKDPNWEVSNVANDVWRGMAANVAKEKWDQGDPQAVLDRIMRDPQTNRSAAQSGAAALQKQVGDFLPPEVTVQRLADKDHDARLFLRHALVRRDGKVIALLLAAMNGPDPRLSEAVRSFLRGKDEAIIYAHSLASANGAGKKDLLRELTRFRHLGPLEVQTIADACKGADPGIREAVIRTLTTIGEDNIARGAEGPWADAFIHGMQDPDPAVREASVQAVRACRLGVDKKVLAFLWRCAESRGDPMWRSSWILLAENGFQMHSLAQDDPNAHRIVWASLWEPDASVRNAARKIKDMAWPHEDYPEPPGWALLRILSWIVGGACAAVAALSGWGFHRAVDERLVETPTPSLDLAGRMARATGIFVIAHCGILLGVATWFRGRGTLTPPEVFGALIVLTIAAAGAGFIGWGNAARIGKPLDRGMLFAWSLGLLLIMGFGLVVNGMVLLAMMKEQDVQYETVGTVVAAGLGLIGAAFVAAQLLRGWANDPSKPALAVAPVARRKSTHRDSSAGS
jgi:HEAT repeat protein